MSVCSDVVRRAHEAVTHVADAPARAAHAHQPLVTIVIPTYDDDPEHLREAVASALAQTHPRVEVVVVDDGSSRPETKATLDALTSVTLVQQGNAGPSAARNAGTAAGTGDVVICLDADDLLSPDFVAQSVAVLGQEHEARVAYPRMEPFGSDTSTAWPTRGKLTVRDFAQRSAVPVCSAFYRDDWAAVGGWDEDLRLGMEDHEWWVRLLGHTGGTAAPLPSAVLHYRVRPGSRSRTRRYADDLAVTRQRILANNPREVLAELLRGAWAATDAAEAEAAGAWSDPWQLRRWGKALRRRAVRATRRVTRS